METTIMGLGVRVQGLGAWGLGFFGFSRGGLRFWN